MRRKKVVSMILDEKFFTKFETARKMEEQRQRKILGSDHIRLSQRQFSEIIANKIDFKLPEQKNIGYKKSRKKGGMYSLWD